MTQPIRTAFDSGFNDLDYSAFFKRQYLRMMNCLQVNASERAASNLVMQNRLKEAATVRENSAKTIQARRRLINQLK